MTYDLTGKTIIITGGNSGIGKAAALKLALVGATVVMACRSAERGARAQEEIRQASGNHRVEWMQVDMASQASIRQFAVAFQDRHARLDGLIHNAANFDLSMKKPVLTEDGVETIFATNHVGIFLLTHLLLDCLLYTSDAADDLPCVDLGGRRIIKKKNLPAINLILYLNIYYYL